MIPFDSLSASEESRCVMSHQNVVVILPWRHICQMAPGSTRQNNIIINLFVLYTKPKQKYSFLIQKLC